MCVCVCARTQTHFKYTRERPSECCQGGAIPLRTPCSVAQQSCFRLPRNDHSSLKHFLTWIMLFCLFIFFCKPSMTLDLGGPHLQYLIHTGLGVWKRNIPFQNGTRSPHHHHQTPRSLPAAPVCSQWSFVAAVIFFPKVEIERRGCCFFGGGGPQPCACFGLTTPAMLPIFVFVALAKPEQPPAPVH